MKLFLLAIVVASIAISPAIISATKFSVCELSKSAAEIKNVVVSDCETLNEACPFIRGFNKSIELDFVPKEKIEQVKVKIFGKLSTVPIPFHINPDSACGNYGFECPLEANKEYKFKLTLPILRSYPKLQVDVFVRLFDQKGDLIGCVELPARIQEPAKPEA